MMLKSLQIGTDAVLLLVAVAVVVVVLGIQQGKQQTDVSPLETKDALQRLRQEHLEQAVPLRK